MMHEKLVGSKLCENTQYLPLENNKFLIHNYTDLDKIVKGFKIYGLMGDNCSIEDERNLYDKARDLCLQRLR
jgi:hypothetical protein